MTYHLGLKGQSSWERKETEAVEGTKEASYQEYNRINLANGFCLASPVWRIKCRKKGTAIIGKDCALE